MNRHDFQPELSRRQAFQILMGLGALGTISAISGCDVSTNPPAPGAAPFASLDQKQATKVGQAYLAGPGAGQTIEKLQSDIFSRGWSLQRLKARVSDDFAKNRMFEYRGWRLSDTEGKLFAVIALAPA